MSRLCAAVTAAIAMSSAVHAEEVRLRIQSAKVAEIPFFREEAVELTLDAQGARDLAAFTADRTGQRVYIYLDGELLMSPYIQSKIPGGQFQISAGPDGYGGLEEGEFIARAAAAGHLVISDTER